MSIYRDKSRGCFVFSFDRRIHGQRVRLVKHLPKTWTRAEADKYSREQEAQLYATATGVKSPEFSIESAVDVYIREHTPNLKHGGRTEKDLALMYWSYAGRPLSELAEACAEYATKAKADGLKPATIKKRIAYLCAACNYAHKHHKMGATRPSEGVVKPQVKNERHFYLDRGQMLMVARKFKTKTGRGKWREARAAFRICFYSGMRRGELFEMVVENGIFKLADTKNGDPRHIPIHTRIRSTVRKFWPIQIGRDTISHSTKAALVAAGLGHMRLHDSRHSTASEMINNDVDLYTVGAVLGHRSAQSTKRYSHLATKSLEKALSNVGKNLSKVG